MFAMQSQQLGVNRIMASRSDFDTNIRAIFDRYLPGKYELEVIDVYQQLKATKDAQIIGVPTLIKELPLPAQRFVGDMSNTEKIVVGLKLKHANGAQ
jgi:circadian clock protein KaiB